MFETLEISFCPHYLKQLPMHQFRLNLWGWFYNFRWFFRTSFTPVFYKLRSDWSKSIMPECSSTVSLLIDEHLLSHACLHFVRFEIKNLFLILYDVTYISSTLNNCLQTNRVVYLWHMTVSYPFYYPRNCNRFSYLPYLHGCVQSANFWIWNFVLLNSLGNFMNEKNYC